MPRWVGWLGSWALLVLAAGVLVYAVAAETITIRDATILRRTQTVDRMIEEQIRRQIADLQKTMSRASTSVTKLQSDVASTERSIDDLQDSNFMITVSTKENEVYARRDGKQVFQAECSTGKNTTLHNGNETIVFRTPIGRFRIQSKEEHPMWVPPDWYFIEEARKDGLKVARLDRDQSIGDLSVHGHDVYSGDQPLPPGQLIIRGGAIIIPPFGTRQRELPDVLGTYRLNLGDGYALHGTQAISQLGRSVSHGCVRLHNDDIAALYQMAKVGDEVIIY